MANPEHLKILEQGVVYWNKWREQTPDIIPDLTGINLSNTLYPGLVTGAISPNVDLGEANRIFVEKSKKALQLWENLRNPNLGVADLRGVNFSRVNLGGANFDGALFYGADLSGAQLAFTSFKGANFRGADLSEANLKIANLEEANLRGADLQGADLTGVNPGESLGANLRGADLAGANLTDAKLCGVVMPDGTVHP